MFFEVAAVIILTFFAALGLVEASDWLMKNCFRKSVKHTCFVVADISSVDAADVEAAVRTLLIETDGLPRKVILDCRGASEEAAEICRNLERRFGCEAVFGEKELLGLIASGINVG